MDFSLQDCLTVLTALGIDHSHDTSSNLPVDTLRRRATKALECTQGPLKNEEIDPKQLKTWKASANKKSVADATMTAMTYQQIARRLAEAPTAGGPFENPYLDLRQTVMSMGQYWDKGLRIVAIEDPQGTYGFTLRMVDVYEVEKGVPGFVVLYEHGPGSAVSGSRLDGSRFLNYRSDGQGIRIFATILEQKMLLKLFESNSKKLSDTFTVQRTPYENKHKISILAPPVPLTFHDIGTLSNNSGCTMCGKHAKSRCAQCQSASYCSKECQTSHWKAHKSTCRSLAGGTWMEIHASLAQEIMPDRPNVISFNRFHTVADTLKDLEKLKNGGPKDAEVPPNMHGDSAFIAKLQATLPGSPVPSIMIYDRHRSFSVYVLDKVDPKAFAAIFTIARRDGYLGSRIYRWMRRTGDFTFSVCLDRVPPGDIKW